MKPINQQAPVVCAQSVLIHATPTRVWRVLSDIAQWPTWQRDVSRAQLHGPLQPRTTFDWKTGGMHIHSTLHTVEPEKRLGWTGEVFGIHAVHNWEFEAKPGGTQVSVSESMEGLLARLFKGAFNRTLAKGMGQSLRELKIACEAMA
ncbi:Uncharacterized conserved protein YndB, AHSA1/START domain [Catalinimonas alkaloidigena]|uniref:Uncharacterized conserved protein YndB, AHSA1/START domain n=1 Tax=Catalinimonas alkaloidigena TaxID=1075417 RepID=A0A1G9UFH7_9BACT|nr:SRPBCC family protein [Catalinimonas alkaloidigena]SDM58666.1 Uncharacterized conserved protein YndB, AHSA1/START domain [Catalinimonas alkaloidigena]